MTHARSGTRALTLPAVDGSVALTPARDAARRSGGPGPGSSADGAFAGLDLATAARIEAGFSAETLDLVRARLELSVGELARLLGTSKSTLERRRGGAQLTPAESDRVYRLGRLVDLAVHALGSDSEARAWMRAPSVALGGAVPLDLARTEPGARLVERELGAIEHGLPV